MSKLWAKLVSLTLVLQPVLEKENSRFKSVIDLEKDGLRLAIPAQDTFYDIASTTIPGYGISERCSNGLYVAIILNQAFW